MRNFYIDGTSSATYNIYASGENAYNAAERNVESISVPGRNGNLLIDNGTFKNIDVKYPCVIPYGFSANAIRSWLMSNAGGYHKITDDYDATHFRMGRVKGGIEFKPMYTNQAAALCDITFDCKPQRFLTSGDTETRVYSGNSINNPTAFTANPQIRCVTVTAGAVLTINGKKIKFLSGGSFNIDCENQRVYYGFNELNDSIECEEFPSLSSGSNSISWTGTISAVYVKPRWWEI